MNRSIIAAITLFTAVGAFAQTAAHAPAAEEQPKIVAVINGETITRAKLDAMYNNMPAPMRAQYEKSGGRMAFLDNYVAKRLLIQEAMKSGFDRRPDVQATLEAAKESALFDRYVREVVASSLVTDVEAKKYYDENQSQFAIPEQAKVRHIVISWNNKPKQDAMELIKRVMTEIRAGVPSARDASPQTAPILLSRFSEAARRYSEDGAGAGGGDLGWVSRGSLDAAFEDAAFNMKPMQMSGIVESQFGYHLIFVEARKPAGTQSWDDAKADIREFLMTQRAADVIGTVKRLTNELRAKSKVAFYPENLR
ncbi:MAG: peptidylprolyl isomerase [Thermoanaerobaculia bacterium]